MAMLGNYPIYALNLPRRVTKKLEDSGIFTLLDLSKQDYKKLIKIHGFGNSTIKLIETKLSNLLISNTHLEIEENSPLSSLYKVVTSEISLSEKVRGETNQELHYLNELKKCLYLLEFSEKEKVILKKRLKYFNPSSFSKNFTLQEIANLAIFKTTRERIRQIERRLSNRISNVIDLFNKNNPTLFASFVDSLRSEVIDVVIVRWPDEHRALFSYDYESLGLTDNFLCFLVEEHVLNKNNLQIINVNGVRYIVDLSFEELNLTKENSIRAIKYLKKNIKPTIFERELINIDSIQSLKEKIIFRKIIQDHSNYVYDTKGVYVKKTMRLSDVAYQILDKKSKPMHFSEVATELRTLVKSDLSDRNAQAILGRAKGIHPVGRGKYALNKWGLKIYSIDRFCGKLSVDSLIRQLLKDKGPQNYETIRDYILSYRAASDITIRQGLGRMGCRQNQLKQYYWFKKRTNLQTVITRLIKSNGPQSIEELISQATKLGYARSYVYKRLSEMGCKRNSEGKYSLNDK